jgi:hypothetical protein
MHNTLAPSRKRLSECVVVVVVSAEAATTTPPRLVVGSKMPAVVALVSPMLRFHLMGRRSWLRGHHMQTSALQQV